MLNVYIVNYLHNGKLTAGRKRTTARERPVRQPDK